MFGLKRSENTSFSKWNRIAVCSLLAITFVYNPFLVASITSGKVSLRHTPSYRATVASLELLEFKNPESQQAVLTADRTVVQGFNSLEPWLQSLGRARDIDAHLAIPNFVPYGNLWFRPPPLD